MTCTQSCVVLCAVHQLKLWQAGLVLASSPGHSFGGGGGGGGGGGVGACLWGFCGVRTSKRGDGRVIGGEGRRGGEKQRKEMEGGRGTAAIDYERGRKDGEGGRERGIVKEMKEGGSCN